MAESTRLEQALARFDDAFAQLEAALAQRTAAGEGAADAAALREERVRMAREVDALRERNDALADTNARASRKVDAAMERIRSVLGEL